MRDDHAILDALTKIGAALSSDDPAGVAALWDVPALVLADQGVRPVASRAEVAAFFADAVRSYREKGTPVATPEMGEVAWITDRIATVRVDWIGSDANGIARERESSFYVMRVGDDGMARIQVAMPHTP